MNFNTDGFNERSNYIHNSNDANRLKKMGPSNIDSSFTKMKIAENKADIKTVDINKDMITEEVRGSRENFIIRNYNIMNSNLKNNSNNPVSKAMNRNRFKNF